MVEGPVVIFQFTDGQHINAVSGTWSTTVVQYALGQALYDLSTSSVSFSYSFFRDTVYSAEGLLPGTSSASAF